MWHEADLPPGRDGYARTLRLPDGAEVTLVITSSTLTPHQRAEVRRKILSQHLERDPSGSSKTSPQPLPAPPGSGVSARGGGHG
ncbi:conserved hypothetical protein [Frankia canadensis]|uniref:Uncharacterized protein n=1 Tax=Frankia canadensis TaxID=1836972 RepID=A0A2I2KIR8_9ACTN|nr:conserved hypothetical protein [Frankia canadensis]SOU52834.1 conserved hypothetical protein [Frankia canadensis]